MWGISYIYSAGVGFEVCKRVNKNKCVKRVNSPKATILSLSSNSRSIHCLFLRSPRFVSSQTAPNSYL